MTPQPYGLHANPDGYSFLLQPSGEQNLIVDGLESGLSKERFQTRYCPHKVDLNDWVEPPAWAADPFVQAFLPTPGAGAFIIRNEDRRYDVLLRQLTRLSGAGVSLLRPMWGTQGWITRTIYEATNLGPVVWISTNMTQATSAAYQIEMANLYQRRVVFITYGPFPVFNLTPLTTDLRDLGHEPLEQIGAGALRQYMYV